MNQQPHRRSFQSRRSISLNTTLSPMQTLHNIIAPNEAYAAADHLCYPSLNPGYSCLMRGSDEGVGCSSSMQKKGRIFILQMWAASEIMSCISHWLKRATVPTPNRLRRRRILSFTHCTFNEQLFTTIILPLGMQQIQHKAGSGLIVQGAVRRD